MRGVEFVAEAGYGDVLNGLFAGIPLEGYDVYLSEEELFAKGPLPGIRSGDGRRLLREFGACAPYYVFFLRLEAYPRGEGPQEIHSYEDFLGSGCRLLLLVSDGCEFEIYGNEERLLRRISRNARALGGKEIRAKGDDDGRVRMHVL